MPTPACNGIGAPPWGHLCILHGSKLQVTPIIHAGHANYALRRLRRLQRSGLTAWLETPRGTIR